MARFKRPAMAVFSLERTLFSEIRFDMRAGVSAVVSAVADDELSAHGAGACQQADYCQ